MRSSEFNGQPWEASGQSSEAHAGLIGIEHALERCELGDDPRVDTLAEFCGNGPRWTPGSLWRDTYGRQPTTRQRGLYRRTGCSTCQRRWLRPCGMIDATSSASRRASHYAEAARVLMAEPAYRSRDLERIGRSRTGADELFKNGQTADGLDYVAAGMSTDKAVTCRCYKVA